MCRCVNVIRQKINKKYEYQSTNITKASITKKLHEIETNLQFEA